MFSPAGSHTKSSQQPKSSWSTFISRPRSSSGRPGSSGSTASSVTSAPRWPRSAGVAIPGNGLSLPIVEGQELLLSGSPPTATPVLASPAAALMPRALQETGLPRSDTLNSPAASPTPTSRRWSTGFLLTSSPKTSPQTVPDQQSPQLVPNTLETTSSNQGSLKSPDSGKNGGSFGKSFTSMMGGFSSLTLSRTNTRESGSEDKDKDKDRGRSMLKMSRPKSSSQAPAEEHRKSSGSVPRTRSQSPFSFRRSRSRNREQSPTPQPIRLSQSDADLSDAPSSIHPRSTAFTDDDSGDDMLGTDAETDDGSSSNEDDLFDPITHRNTERNALIIPVATDAAGVAPEIEDPDPVGEGVNVIVAPEPYFPSSLNSSSVRGKKNPRRRKSVKHHEPLPFHTARPLFQRDRCTITMTQGDPEGTIGERRKRRYVVASDLSEESRYAVEWGIGTVLRDGDEMLIVTVVENEAKVDPAVPNSSDRATKLRGQQERQGLAYILVRQVTGLLQRTRLNVTISCQAWHAKNSRHMLLDVVDHIEPTMLIVGSRGLGQLNGILLGSTSHYLIQKCSVPVMVARRRLKRPPRKSAHLSTQRVHVSLAEAGIDRVAAKVDQDVQDMRNEIQKEDNRRDGGPGSRNDGHFNRVTEDGEGEDEADDDVDDGDEPGIKVAG